MKFWGAFAIEPPSILYDFVDRRKETADVRAGERAQPGVACFRRIATCAQ
jgi:hypothetical protein